MRGQRNDLPALRVVECLSIGANELGSVGGGCVHEEHVAQIAGLLRERGPAGDLLREFTVVEASGAEARGIPMTKPAVGMWRTLGRLLRIAIR